MSVTNSTKALIGLLLAGSVGVIIFLFVHLSSDPSKPLSVGSKAAAACTKGQRDCLPDVNYTDTQGKAYTPADLAGKVVVVNFWATWCKPCQKEIPDFSKVYEKLKAKGLVMLGVMTDSPDNDQLLNFQSDYDMLYPVVRANSDILVSYSYPDALPTTYVFDRGGKQVFSHVGPLHAEKLEMILAPLLAQSVN
ncbi:MAG: TlpA family protein disulfide reductase [Deltaproteobacteria bacterium]|nr:TlpA family protein disulfide reductase [Deltaproteobacteria bacterium]